MGATKPRRVGCGGLFHENETRLIIEPVSRKSWQWSTKGNKGERERESGGGEEGGGGKEENGQGWPGQEWKTRVKGS